MISTRQLIFIISIVFFFVNRATSGQSSSSRRASRRRAGALRRSAENVENPGEVYIKNLNYCILELTTAFQKHENNFDNLLYAFLNLIKADFEAKIYSEAAYDYYYDLLNTAYDIRTQPVLYNPRQYCENFYGYQVKNCIRNIAELGCQADDDAIMCVNYLYLNWRKINMSNIKPLDGTESISDQELMNAISRGPARFPGLSNEELRRRISDVRLQRDFYAQYTFRLSYMEHLQQTLKYYYRIETQDDEDPNGAYTREEDPDGAYTREQDLYRQFFEQNIVDTDINVEDRFRQFVEEDRFRRFLEEDHRRETVEEERFRRLTEERIDNYRQFYEEGGLERINARNMYNSTNKEYTKQRDLDIKEARYECYGIANVSYDGLIYEYNRRQKINQNYYAMYLHDQLEIWGKTQMEEEEKNKFQDPKNFCTNYLSNNSGYYNFLDD